MNKSLPRLYQRLNQPLDIASLAVFRILFGTLMFVGTLRFMSSGWIEPFYVEPVFHFKYWGFEWVVVPDQTGLYLLYSGIAVSAALVALGAFYRFAIIGFWCLFTYAELMDVTYYLNHYYLVSLLALILCFLSPHRAWSFDAWRKPALRADYLPAWQTYWLRFQVGLLYFYAGLAKFEADWVFNAQPLNIWLPPLSGMPIIGPLLEAPWVHFGFSWFALTFDTTIIAFLLWKRTRPCAFVVVLIFHLFTHLFFQIGIFPFIMVIAVLVFFEPDWPRTWVAAWNKWRNSNQTMQASPSQAAAFTPVLSRRSWSLTGGAFTVIVSCFCLMQFAMPLRQWLYPGTVLWNEQGMRFSWRVMLREKSGSLQYRVVRQNGDTTLVSPHDYLTELQYREMAGQPDLILQLAHHIRDDFNQSGTGPVKVFADSLVSLNGRPAAALIDPTVDLASIENDLKIATWVTEQPDSAPPLQQPLRLNSNRWVANQ